MQKPARGGLRLVPYWALCDSVMIDNVVLASIYRLTAVNFRGSAQVLFEKFKSQGEPLPRNIRAIPFYYLVSHAIELLLKCALLTRGRSLSDLKALSLRHNLKGLLQDIIILEVPISENAVSLIELLSNQHERHQLRYTALLDDGEPTFTPGTFRAIFTFG